MQLLFACADFIVIDKPTGVPVLPEGWDRDAPYLVKKLESDHGKVWVVHRLDKVTSGVMVFALNKETHRALNQLFEERQVIKEYHAIVVGIPGWEEHTARHPLRINVGHSHRTVADHRHGKPSVTAFRVLERFKENTLLEAHPYSGRTHQVRAHASALGFPLLGDEKYDAPGTELITRPALHAIQISFTLQGQSYSFQAPYPDDYRKALEALRAGC